MNLRDRVETKQITGKERRCKVHYGVDGWKNLDKSFESKDFFMKDLLHQMVCVAMILHPCNKMSVVLILSINSMNGRIFALPCRYCYCCWQEDPKKQQFLVFAASAKQLSYCSYIATSPKMKYGNQQKLRLKGR